MTRDSDKGSIGDTEVISAEGFHVPLNPTGPEVLSTVDPEDIPSPEERDAILDWVNRAPPILPGDDGQVGAGPAPGTESQMGPGQQPNDILDRVNRGAPLLPESHNEAGEEPTPGTESFIGPGEEQDILDGVNRGGPELPDGNGEVGEELELGTESDVEQRSWPGGFLIWLIETLRNWWQELLT